MKVLIISYNPLTLSDNGGKRLCSLFSSFKEEEMIQLYVYPRLPDRKRCSSYFRLTDLDVLDILIRRKKNHSINSFEEINSINELSNIYKDSSRYRSIKLLMRDILWKISPWMSRELDDWIINEKPDCIFSDTGDSCFLYNITMRISKKYNLPVVCSFGDDYCSISTSWRKPIDKFQKYLLRNKIREFIHNCKNIITVNDKFSNYYKNIFSIENSKIQTIYMGYSFDFSSLTNKPYSYNPLAVKFSYIGNLSLGRWENLIKIGKSLDRYNDMNNTNHTLSVYGRSPKYFIDESKFVKSIVLKGFIPGDKVLDAITNSDILIHTESFKEENIAKTRYSLSTKIADSLESGKMLLAYGPSDIASMEHLIKNECAYIIKDEKDLDARIDHLLKRQELMDCISKKGKYIAKKFHDAYKDSLYLKSLLQR